MSQLGLGPGTLERKNPALIKSLEGYNVLSIASGALHNAIVMEGGQVWTWGCNDDCALGRVTDEWLPGCVTAGGIDRARITSVVCGDSHTLALDSDGQLWSWGTYKDSKGVIGYDAANERQAVPARVRTLSRRVIGIASGENHDLAVTDAGEVF